MNKEQYLQLRNDGNLEIMYIFYKENFKEGVHKPLLSNDQFYKAFLMWPFQHQAVDRVLQYYDVMFNVLSINTGKKMIYV